MTHESRISHSRLNPALAPRLVVLISSPVPTIEAARISPGPICWIAAVSLWGGSLMASSRKGVQILIVVVHAVPPIDQL